MRRSCVGLRRFARRSATLHLPICPLSAYFPPRECVSCLVAVCKFDFLNRASLCFSCLCRCCGYRITQHMVDVMHLKCAVRLGGRNHRQTRHTFEMTVLLYGQPITILLNRGDKAHALLGRDLTTQHHITMDSSNGLVTFRYKRPISTNLIAACLASAAVGAVIMCLVSG